MPMTRRYMSALEPRGRKDGCPKVRQLHGEVRILDEQQQTGDECRQNAGDMDRIQTTACQSRHQGVPAAVCQHSISHQVSNLGVHLDIQLTMQDHVAAMCRSCFFQLRQLWTIRSSLTTDAAKPLNVLQKLF